MCLFQPLSSFSSKKCKRCGFYEEDSITSDDAFDEWEFCPSDFAAPNGEYIRFKEKEFNATFLCPECLSLAGGEYLQPFYLKSLDYHNHAIWQRMSASYLKIRSCDLGYAIAKVIYLSKIFIFNLYEWFFWYLFLVLITYQWIIYVNKRASNLNLLLYWICSPWITWVFKLK